MTEFFDFISNQITNIYNFYMSSNWLKVYLLVGVITMIISLIINFYGRKE